MSVTDVAVRRESGSESIVELVAALAVVALTIVGLAEVTPPFLVAIATIVFGVGLLLYGTSALSQLNVALARYSASETSLRGVSSGWSTLFLAGVASIVPGILALLDVSSTELVAIAAIAFAASSLISGNASTRMRIMAATPTNPDPMLARIVGDMTTDTTGVQTMAGFPAIVLGILALSGFAPTKLVLIALLELGCFSSVTSAAIGGTFAGAFRVAPHG